MNLYCPNCQKNLTVPDNYAGQVMKCPLCNGVFTVPGLPGPVHDAPATVEVPAPVSTLTAAPASTPPPPADPVAAPAPAPPVTTAPAPSGVSFSFTMRPEVLQWVPAVCCVLIFFLQFFSWLGVYPGGQPAVQQGIWSAAFGSVTTDPDLEKAFELKENFKPGVSGMAILYVLLFVPTLVVSVGVVAIGMGTFRLPPAVVQLLPWKWAIVGGLNLLTFLFLVFQMLGGFSLETKYREWADQEAKADLQRKKPDAAATPEKMNTVDKKLLDAFRGQYLASLTRTVWFRLAVLLHVLAILAAGMLFWLNQRGNRPLPRVDFVC